MDSHHLQSFLRLGLTGQQARAYEALLRLGESGAYGVAQAANLAPANTYSALQGLVAHGAARLLPGRPRRYRAEEPQEWLPALGEGLAAEARQTAADLEPLVSRPASGGPEEAELRGGRALGRVLRPRLEAAAERVLLAGSAREIQRWQPALASASSRGVEVSVLLAGGPLPFPAPAAWLVGLEEGAPVSDPPWLWVVDGAAVRGRGRGSGARGRLLEDPPFADLLARGILARIGWSLAAARAGGRPAREEQRARRRLDSLPGG